MNDAKLDLNRVAMFVQIAEAGGVSNAAAKMKLPKSSVSRGLTLLEAELGVELVVRSSRKFRLSDSGRAFFEAASKGINAVADAREELRQDKSAPRGVVRVAAPPGFATFVVAPVVAAFVREHREVEVELFVTGKKVDPVRDGFDIVVSIGKLDDSSSKTRALGAVDTGVFASPLYLSERGTPRRPSDLKKHDCILHTSSGRRERWSLKGSTGTTVVAVGGRIRVDDLTTAAAAAVGGAGLVVLPLHMTAKHPAAGELVRVLPDHVLDGEPTQIVFPASRHLPLRVKMLCDALVRGASSTCHADANPGAPASAARLRSNGHATMMSSTSPSR